MNIFATFPDPQLSAMFLDDKRVRKLLQEAVDLLCTTLSTAHPHAKPTFYQHHPATKWVKADYRNAYWVFLHASYLSFECEYRFGKIDYVHQLILEDIAPIFWVPAARPVEFYRGASHKGLGISFNHLPDIHKAYRKYLRARWPGDVRTPIWTGCKPQWKQDD